MRVQIEYFLFIFSIKKKGQNKVKTTILGDQLQEHRKEGSDTVEEGKTNNPISMMEMDNLSNQRSKDDEVEHPT